MLCIYHQNYVIYGIHKLSGTQKIETRYTKVLIAHQVICVVSTAEEPQGKYPIGQITFTNQLVNYAHRQIYKAYQFDESPMDG